MVGPSQHEVTGGYLSGVIKGMFRDLVKATIQRFTKKRFAVLEENCFGLSYATEK